MYTTNVSIAQSALPSLRRIAEQVKNPVALYKSVGRRAAEMLRKHYAGLDATRANSLGGNRTHFWLEVRDAVQQPEPIPGGVSIVIGHPVISGKIYGAIVTPQEKEALSIPIHALAHGRRPSVFEEENNTKLFRPKGKRILMAEIGGEVVPIYALAKRVNLAPDPEALPDKDAFVEGIVKTAESYYKRDQARESSSEA